MMKTIDLFAGVGGISHGFNMFDFETVFANDIEPKCKETYDLNSKSVKLSIGDITKLDLTEIPKFDVLLGGFPCQPFSVAGYRKGFDDEGRGNLFFNITEILEIRKPKAFLLENVKNLKGHDNGKTFEVISKKLKELGYYFKAEILNGKTHGNIPQNRERIFIVGFLEKKHYDLFEFPKTIDLKTSFRDLLETEVDEKYYYNGKPLYDKLKDDVINKNRVYQWRRQYVRENKCGVCPTLTANMGTGGHNVPIILDAKGIRKLTPKECFNLQGFPKEFKLPLLSDAKLYHQAGNSVIFPIIQRIAKKMNDILNT